MKTFKKILKWVLIVLGVLLVLGLVAGTGGSKDGTLTASKKEEETAETATAEPIEYQTVAVSQMMEDLTSNALKAQDTYKGQYIEITGKLNVIDSNGKYISLVSADDEFAITGVQCYIKTDEQRSQVAQMSKGDIVTLRGKCKDVGEVLGYSLDIDSID